MGPTSIDNLIDKLWKDLLVVAERHEKQMLANINGGLTSSGNQKQYNDLRDWFQDVYDSISLTQNTNLRNDAWTSLPSNAIPYDTVYQYMLKWKILDEDLFYERLQEYLNNPTKQNEKRLQGVIFQEIDFLDINQALTDWGKQYNMRIDSWRQFGHEADIKTEYLFTKDFAWGASIPTGDILILPYADSKLDAEDFTVTGMQPRTGYSTAKSFEYIHDTLMAYAKQGDLPSDQQLNELTTYCMVEAAFQNKNYPYFISMHAKGSEVKINLCSTTIKWHLKYHANQSNQGFYLIADTTDLSALLKDLQDGIQEALKHLNDSPEPEDYSKTKFLEANKFKRDRQVHFFGVGSAWKF